MRLKVRDFKECFFFSIVSNYIFFSFLPNYAIMQAMHLVYKALEKYAIPSVLPPELMPPNKRKDIIISKTKSPTLIGMTVTAPLSSQSQAPPLSNTTTLKSLTGLDAVKVFIF